MVKVQQRFLIAAALAALVFAPQADARRFYPDDPVQKTPPPRRVENPFGRKLSDYYDFFLNTFFQPWEKHTSRKIIRAGGVNTLDEVPDSPWYTNRHGVKRMSIEELRRGPGIDNAPAQGAPWTIVGAKPDGITPGFTIEDSETRRFAVKVDPRDYPELASGADVIGSKFFHAFGYNVPENYVFTFRREDLIVGKDIKIVDVSGRQRTMKSRDLDELLLNAPRDENGVYRGIASYFIKGKLLGPFRYHGVRSDDPNDVVPHEHRRDLRGLYVFSAWVGHNDFKSLQGSDSLVEEGPLKYIRHYLLDFSGILGSDSFTIKSPRAGYEYLFSWDYAVTQFLTLGLKVPEWALADYPDIRGAGRFESKIFDPEEWKPNYPNGAFDNRLPDDLYWGAKQVMRFSDPEIRAIVETGEFSDPKAVEWLTRALIERRDKIGRAFFAKVLPLENFRFNGTRLEFDDLEVQYGFTPRREYRLQWSHFENESSRKTPVQGEAGHDLPQELRGRPAGSFYCVDIHGGNPAKSVSAYFRMRSNGVAELVGIERKWPLEGAGIRMSNDVVRTSGPVR